MILALVAIIAVVVLALVGAIALEGSFVGDMILPVMVAMGILVLLVYPFGVYNYIAAGTKAEIINREYGTSYTQQEVFYASDVIDTVQELKRQRIQLNGDLMQKKD